MIYRPSANPKYTGNGKITRSRVEDAVLSLLKGKTNPTGSWTELCSEHGTMLYMLSSLKFHKYSKKDPSCSDFG